MDKYAEAVRAIARELGCDVTVDSNPREWSIQVLDGESVLRFSCQLVETKPMDVVRAVGRTMGGDMSPLRMEAAWKAGLSALDRV